jgi:PhnB protein
MVGESALPAKPRAFYHARSPLCTCSKEKIMITTTTHLNFRGTAHAALEFYQSVFGGQIAAITFADAHNVQSKGGLATEEEANQIMWGQVLGDNGFHVTYWNGLKAGATIMADLGPAPWGAPLYGMLKDKFGVTWVLDVQASY